MDAKLIGSPSAGSVRPHDAVRPGDGEILFSWLTTAGGSRSSPGPTTGSVLRPQLLWRGKAWGSCARICAWMIRSIPRHRAPTGSTGTRRPPCRGRDRRRRRCSARGGGRPERPGHAGPTLRHRRGTSRAGQHPRQQRQRMGPGQLRATRSGSLRSRTAAGQRGVVGATVRRRRAGTRPADRRTRRRHRERAASWGRIIGLTSGGELGFPEEVSYGAAKAAQTNYTMSAASELAELGITANMVHPPITDTGWVTDEVPARPRRQPDTCPRGHAGPGGRGHRVPGLRSGWTHQRKRHRPSLSDDSPACRIARCVMHPEGHDPLSSLRTSVAKYVSGHR